MGQRLVIVGGDAAGMSAATQARRLRPDLEIVALEKGAWTSYSACGIPYVVGGSVPGGLDQLVVRTPEQFRAMHIDARVDHEVTGIDLDARQLEVHNHHHGRVFRLGFDLLHLATGAVPRRPPVPGIDGPHVHGVQTLSDAATLLSDATANPAAHVVVVGGGYVGLELAEAFLARGASVSVVEREPEVMSALDPDMGALVNQAMREAGISVHTGVALEAVEDGEAHTSDGPLRADLVILGTGVAPNSALAAEAGLDLGLNGSIVVDRRQQTSAEGVWAAGDCCQARHVVSGQPTYVALGTAANKQGRVAGVNQGGGYATFDGVAGTAATRLCRLEIARTGLSTREARATGFDVVEGRVESTNIAGYLPGAELVTVKVIAERGSGRVLGAQIVGGAGAAKRIDVMAAVVTAAMTAEDLVQLDLAYAPPFSPLWDPVQVAARHVLPQLR